jgi:hypothetical protein
MADLYPMLIAPRYDERIWGGHNLAERLGKSAPRERVSSARAQVTHRPQSSSVLALVTPSPVALCPSLGRLAALYHARPLFP